MFIVALFAMTTLSIETASAQKKKKQEDVIVMAMEKTMEQKITNVLFMDLDAERIEDFFEKGEISRIYLNFSDPWPKNRHHLRRLSSKIFLDKYENIFT